MKVFLVKVLKKMIKLLDPAPQLLEDPSDSGFCELFGVNFYYHHKPSFEITYEEVFQKGIYTFDTKNPSPTIIDCGANMGLSLLFFFLNYPNAKIYAFEPDKSVLEYLDKNITNYEMNNVELIKKAAWIRNEFKNFYTDGGMGGSLENDCLAQTANKIEAIRLKEFIGNKHIDMLKIDIEGAESLVLQDCEPLLKQIDNIFIEFHSFESEEQKLDDLLTILKRNNFRYHLSQSFSRNKPFIDRELICNKMDLAINVFGYR